MMIDRREAIKSMLALGAAPFIGCGAAAARIIIIGGGFGGAVAAQTLKTLSPNLSVKLIEPKQTYTACPLSNLVIAGRRALSAQQFNYDGLRARGVGVIHDRATEIDPVSKIVRLGSGDSLIYDRLIMAPGIDFHWNAIEGLGRAAAQTMPHAWSGSVQTKLLRDQLSAMRQGGRFVISVPRAPFRCPPGPYERASLAAHFFKTNNPRAKILILDANDQFSKQELFESAWASNFPGMIEWRGASDDGIVRRVDANTKTVHTDFETIKADVANIIPPHMAAAIAKQVGSANESGWCPVNALDFSSQNNPDIHIIGDAAIAAPMPKSAFSAALQARLCALQIVTKLSGRKPAPTKLSNTCYSFISPGEAISITSVYENENGLKQIAGAGGTSPLGAGPNRRAQEAAQAHSWFGAITQQAFQ